MNKLGENIENNIEDGLFGRFGNDLSLSLSNKLKNSLQDSLCYSLEDCLFELSTNIQIELK